ncbi:MAG: glutamine synthetase type III [Bacteroidetes bacterium]|nr:MAG: glutamine synthetase type III [Bacteroidota bacterium]
MNARYQALRLLQSRPPVPPTDQSRRPSEIYAQHVFTKKVMKHYLAKETYLALKETIEKGKTLDKGIAGPVANSIKAWAMDKGVTHFTHWFQPLTGRTAEKHDSFLELSGDEPIDKFSGDELSQQEPDASSFPSGGLRRTFEARGYTAWDCSSPIFIFETTYGKTLCIPTIFVSYTGEALDYKIPLLKSISMLDKAATAVAKLFDPEVSRVVATLGLEQEYFLIDRALFDLRPDLILTGRTVFGAASARGQQLDDHYFGAIPERAFAFMNELEQEAHKLGIPLRTRHNEVAPGQFECAPQFEGLNVAIDHGLMVMDLIDRVARKHHLAALLHEKPFAGINGSGKHNNWSMSTDTGKNLLAPGQNPEENLMFLAFFTTVIRAVYEHADLMRASIASAGNDHRLGANEAPPAIISVFIGSRLSKILDDIENPPRRKKNEHVSDLMHLGIAEIPELLLDNTDRNRTSPFAFTGNKFEFRAVGSSANSSNPMTILNVIVAEQLKDFHHKVERKINRGRKLEAAVLDIIREYIVESKAIRFEGDGYSQEWADEAARRGLSNVKQTPRALDFMVNEKAMALFTTTGLFTEAEIHARHEVQLENYLTKVTIETDIAEELARTKIIPAATDYLREIQGTLPANATDDGTLAPLRKLRDDLAAGIGKTLTLLEELGSARAKAEAAADLRAQAITFGEEVLPVLDQIRNQVDQLEMVVKDAYWPLPKYREMLFIR